MNLNVFLYTAYPPPTVLVVDNGTNVLSPTLPLEPWPLSYSQEASRRYGITACDYCPYNRAPDGPNPPGAANGVFVNYKSMYGPCLDAQRSTKVACVQHPLFRPVAFVGEYFYADQRLWEEASRYIESYYVAQDVIPSPLQGNPSDYGLGKKKLREQLLQNKVVYTGNHTENVVETERLYGQYRRIDGEADGWLLWAQHSCTEACHRNAQYWYVQVRAEDYEGKSPVFQFLHQRDATNKLLKLIRCSLCPPYHASYLRPIDSPPYWAQAFSRTCYPWFGAVPLLNSANSLAFVVERSVAHGQSVDGVLQPAQNSTYYASEPCVVNTYNDVCAHTLQWYARVAAGSTRFPSEHADATVEQREKADARKQCKPCPAGGYHTDGQVGAWFCVPPVGHLLVHRALLRNPLFMREGRMEYWSRRDRFAYELECGYKPAHCAQCPNVTGMTGLLPDEFNQLKILGPLLTSRPCPSGRYCPHPLWNDSLPCPVGRPWSPEGSWEQGQCKCAQTTYWNGSGCQPCPPWDSCQSGEFRRGWTACMYADGAVSGGVCEPCTNKPALGAKYLGSGLDWMRGASVNDTTGVCPFACADDRALKATGQASTCLLTYTCDPLPAFMKGGKQVYAESLSEKRDELKVNPNSEQGVCQRVAALSIALKAATDDDFTYPSVSSTCSGVGGCNHTHPCTVARDATVFSNVVCLPCAALLPGTRFTASAQSQSVSIDKRGLLCQYECVQSNAYVNHTLGQCESCADLAARVCPPGWLVKGGGCNQDFTPFPALAESIRGTASCTNCTVSPSSVVAGYYLDMVTCTTRACRVHTSGSTYWKERCGQATAGVLANCTHLQDCGPTQYLVGACSEDADAECLSCTRHKPGFSKTVNCSLTANAEWIVCPVDSYCPGGYDEAPRRCPFPQKSVEGASSASDCYCPAGTRTTNTLGQCVPMRCASATPALAYAPGDNYASNQYMALDALRVSQCYPCTLDDARSLFTREPYAVGQQACRCPAGQKRTLTASGNLTCPSCSGTSCWRDGATSPCPPFSTGCTPTVTCHAGFLSVSGSTTPSALMTGSAAYLPEAALTDGWSTLLNVDGYTVSHLAATSDKGTDGKAGGYHLLLFSVVANPLVVYAAALPPGSLSDIVNPMQLASRWCPKTTQQLASVAYQTMALSVSQWPSLLSLQNQPINTVDASRFAWVAQAVYAPDVDKLWLYTNKVSLLSTGSVGWSTGGDCGNVFLQVLLASACASGCQVVAMQHQFAYPAGSATSDSAFYLALNDPVSMTMALLVSHVDGRTPLRLNVTGSTSRQLTAMAVAVRDGQPILYLAFNTSSRTVYLVQDWGASSLTEEVFLTMEGVVDSLSLAWATDSLLWARVRRGNAMGLYDTSIESADLAFQRTFTLVQDMPWSSQPTLGPLVIPTGADSGMLLSSFGPRIFVLPTLKRCIPAYVSAGAPRRPHYWDAGRSQCVAHACQRERSCTAVANQFYNYTIGRCMCDAGYYLYTSSTQAGVQACVQCTSGSYCARNERFSCPSQMTSPAGSSSVVHCLCQLGHYYQTSSATCQPCAAGSWCPNQWESMPCPGVVDSTRTVSEGNIYPYACVCAAGFTGPQCGPCPPNHKCVSGSTAVNYAMMLQIRANAPQVVLTTENVCPQVRGHLLNFLNQQSVGVLSEILCALMRTTQRTPALVVLVVQSAGQTAASSLPQIWTDFSDSTFVVEKVLPEQQAVSVTVQANAPMLCAEHRTSNAARTACVCSPGYQTGSRGDCLQCEVNTFKADVGVGACLSCPLGTTSLPGSAACVDVVQPGRTSNATLNGGGGANVAAIAGGVVGGVALVGGVVFVASQYYVGLAAVPMVVP